MPVCLALLPKPGGADVPTATAKARSGAFDATGTVACAQEVGQTLGTCKANVARDGDSAVVVATFANGFSRMLTFDAGAFLRGNSTMSGVGTDIAWDLSDGVFRVRVDDQRFEIDETLVFGD